MSGGEEERLRIVLDQLARLSGMPPPPVITPDQLATGQSAISQLLKVLGIAANGGDPGDNLAALAGHDEREAKVADALGKFPANEEQSSARLAGVGGQTEMSQMVQQMPQMAAGIAGGIAGALGGALQPLSQIPQQLAQAGQQAMQMGMGALQHGVGGAATGSEAVPAELETGGGGEEFGGHGAGSGGGGGGIGTTLPTAMLTPLQGSSAGTLPASSHATSPAPPSPPEAQTAPRGGMGAMPIMPPGMAGAGPGSDPKAETKRVLVPSVKNGAPVQGRITTPPPTPEVIKRVDGKPVATRRILLPEHKRDDETGSGR
ncbi:hypothetical protein A9W99_24860 [Mycobacterium sp. 1164966.3]|uniref:hypothetical protein n=1 Tax=Mycobacterium sp. 1164966.3 TaxID=1856861 RepID=UPI000800B671|nr:hypothetical protein [Mycobacterium sp. 1164966.3]OBA78345.1 hypothetical protein A9W99_24860 [Mycobacterium sp. 1164966.3]